MGIQMRRIAFETHGGRYLEDLQVVLIDLYCWGQVGGGE